MLNWNNCYYSMRLTAKRVWPAACYFNTWRRYEEARGLVFFYAFPYIFHGRTLALKFAFVNWYDKYNLKPLYGGGFCLFVTRSRMNRLRGWSNPPDRIFKTRMYRCLCAYLGMTGENDFVFILKGGSDYQSIGLSGLTFLIPWSAELRYTMYDIRYHNCFRIILSGKLDIK